MFWYFVFATSKLYTLKEGNKYLKFRCDYTSIHFIIWCIDVYKNLKSMDKFIPTQIIVSNSGNSQSERMTIVWKFNQN